MLRLGRTRKFRGHRTHGAGRKGNRGKGKRGGAGNAGLHKHKWKYTVKFAPDHFGPKGFVHQPHPRTAERCINLWEVERNLLLFQAQGAARVEKALTEINLRQAGYDKLLGTGRLGKVLHIIVGKATPRAIERVQAAGGKVTIQPQGSPDG